MIENQHITVVITGKANTKSEAISRAMGKIQKQIFSKIDQLVVRAEPESIEEVEAIAEEYTERFLFLFMPRKRIRCSVTLNVEVNIKTMDPQKLNWQQKALRHPIRRHSQ